MTEAEILRRYAAGDSVNAIGLAARTYNAKVKRVLLAHGVSPRTQAEQSRIAGSQKRRILSEKVLRALYERYLLFEPLQRLAAAARVEHRRLLQEFRDRGWSLRSRSVVMGHANRKRLAFTDEEARELRIRYEVGASADELARERGRHPTAVRDAIRRVGGTIRSANDAARRCTLDEHAFDALTPPSLYWLGILMTDGSISKATTAGPNRSPTIKLALKREDRPHIEAFKRFMRSSHRVYDGRGRVERKWCPTSEIGFSSRIVADRLASYGVTQRKSLTARAHVDLCKSRDFWRGVVDGDGSLGVYADRGRPGPRLALGGSESLLHQFADYCEPLLQQRPRPRAHTKARMWVLSLAGKATVILARHLYADAVDALARKADIAGAIERQFGTKTDWKPGTKQLARDAYFDERLRLLRDFAAEHGHAEVPAAYAVGRVRLGRWVQRQRDDLRLGLSRLTEDRVRQLEGVPGWRWAVGKGQARGARSSRLGQQPSARDHAGPTISDR